MHQLAFGRDFQSMHKEFIFQYDRSKVELVPKQNADICSSVVLGVKPVSFFSNLLPGYYFTTTKSERHNALNYLFILKEFKRLKNDDIICPSNSFWPHKY